ncbi:putative lipase [Wickerhamomyces ciferrii]|uniref:Lipase n=1 Tax=Wickerhamomyces ciferrii (strain ATCC 14091 / BCRC 22168 / CBS 111 / JCM 3599 / NBRC 0793 / NRRL Y-1031 F-60-10) TaxID=1206466 RepID=K0KM14_WICCF|nr:putative lipase [Wickerhamomyces ciferrii]CCH42409.1 putative lipase [Wickerhamomyces ciferrii]
MKLTDLPTEILVDGIFNRFDSLHTYKALSQTCHKFKDLLSESLLVIHNDDSKSTVSQRLFDLNNLNHVNICKISLESLLQMIQKYHFFIFNLNIDDLETQVLHNQIKMLKIILKCLQTHQVHHTVYVNAKDFSSNPLIRFLLPKLNSSFTEFYFPLVSKIEGFDDLRLLDNTNCYFSQLKEMTIGSLSFQLFNLKAPKLKILNQSEVILKRVITESVSTTRITSTKFLDNLKCSKLEVLEVIGGIEKSTLDRFKSLQVLRIYADNNSQSINIEQLSSLKELVISKCSKLEHIVGLGNSNSTLEHIDISNNKNYNKTTMGNFPSLKRLNLSNTKISTYPEIQSSERLLVNVEGCASHLHAIEETIHDTIQDSAEKIVTIRPKSSALFKTYDGIEIVGQRMLLEVLHEVQRLLQDDGIAVSKISFVGYSLGGLISRYMIGELEKLGFFDTVEPQYFTTFASPHLGVFFFKPWFSLLNFLGSSILGLVGKELFIKDQGKILVRLSEGEYFKGLERFQKRYIFANIRHDRSVNFYTAFLTNKNPFDKHWDQLDLKFEFDEDLLSTYTVRGIDVKPKIVNLETSTFREKDYKPPKTSWTSRFKYAGVLVLVCFILPIWIPLIFTASTIGSITSYFIVRTYKGPDIDALRELANNKKRVIDYEEAHGADDITEEHEPLQERLEDATGEALENVINVGHYSPSTDSTPPTACESVKEKLLGKTKAVVKEAPKILILKSKVDQLYKYLNAKFLDPDVEQYEIFQKTDALPLNHERIGILNNLNQLTWNKFAVYVNVLNAHDGIIARKGLKKSTVKGVATVYFWGELINREIRESYK